MSTCVTCCQRDVVIGSPTCASCGDNLPLNWTTGNGILKDVRVRYACVGCGHEWDVTRAYLGDGKDPDCYVDAVDNESVMCSCCEGEGQFIAFTGELALYES